MKENILKVGLCYDVKSMYNINEQDFTYTDFISLDTVGKIRLALESNGYLVEYIEGLENLKKLILEETFPYDIVFNVAEGFKSTNRESLIPALLETYGIPFTGSDVYPMSLCSNKYDTKIICEHLNIKTPEYYLLTKDTYTDFEENISYPFIVKPVNEGGSMGVYKVNNLSELKNKTEDIINTYNCDVLCEKYIEGREITVPIIGNESHATALEVILTTTEDDEDLQIYSSEIKHNNDYKDSIYSALDKGIYNKILNDSLKIHKYFKLKDYSRIDYRIDKDNNYYFLEINQLPSLGEDGSFEISAKNRDLTFEHIIKNIVISALNRYNLVENFYLDNKLDF